MSKAIRIIHYEDEAVGRRIKSTKKRYTWKFALNDKIHTIELFASRFSGKRTLKINGDINFEGKKEGKIFHKTIEIGGHSIIVIEVGKAYDLRIDGVSFQILYKQATFGSSSSIGDSATMSNKLIPEHMENWEKLAKPYDNNFREGVSATTREILPIRPKRVKGRLTISKPEFDPRFVFAGSPSPTHNDLLAPPEFGQKPRAFSTTSYRPSQSDFSTANNPFF
jgi:hypothetical protein